MDKPYKIWNMANGLKVLFIPITHTNHVYYNIDVRCGLFTEKQNEIEISHFLEHFQSFYTSKQHKKYSPIQKYIENTGCYNSASTSKFTSMYYGTCLSKYFLQIFSICLLSFNEFVIDKTLWKPEKNAILEELRGYLNDPWVDMNDRTRQVMFSGISGAQITMKERLDHSEKRTIKEVIDFHKTYYSPEKMLISVAGDFNLPKTLKTIETIFHTSTTKIVKQPRLLQQLQPNQLLFQGPRVLYVRNPKAENTKIQFNWILRDKIKPNDVKNYETTWMISSILTTGFESRLMKKLRTEKKLVYYVWFDYDINFNHTGFVRIETETKNEQTPLVVEIINKEIKRLKTELVSPKELKRVKNKQLLFVYQEEIDETPSKYVNMYSNFVMYNEKVVLYRDRVKAVNSVSTYDIRKTARLIFQKQDLLISYSGKVKSSSNFISSL